MHEYVLVVPMQQGLTQRVRGSRGNLDTLELVIGEHLHLSEPEHVDRVPRLAIFAHSRMHERVSIEFLVSGIVVRQKQVVARTRNDRRVDSEMVERELKNPRSPGAL